MVLLWVLIITACVRPAAGKKPDALQRYALLIGNEDYKDAPLNNPMRDVEALGKMLSQQGWEVTVEDNLNRRELRQVTDDFVSTLPEGSAALFYYAGHGLGFEGENYLVPIGFAAEHPADVADESYKLETIQEKLTNRRGGMNIIIVDACRNEFSRSLPFRSERVHGFAAARAPLGREVFVVLSALAGMAASDGPRGKHSPFASALLRHLPNTGLEINQLMNRVRRDVLVETRGQQTPQTISQLTQGFVMDGRVLDAEEELKLVTTAYAERAERSFEKRGKKAIIVAAADYSTHPTRNSLSSARDLVLVARTLGNLNYQPDQITLLGDEGGPLTGEQVRSAFQALLDKTRQGDQVWLHYSGHGKLGSAGWLLPDGEADSSSISADADPGVISGKELQSWLFALSSAAGITGRIIVTNDSNCMFSTETSARTSFSEPGTLAAPIVILEGCDSRFISYEIDVEGDRFGALSLLLSKALEGSRLDWAWDDILKRMNDLYIDQRPDFKEQESYFRLVGQGRIQVNGELRHGRPVLEIDDQYRYGPSSVFLQVGHLDGVFAGARVALLESGNLNNRVEGTVVQAGMRRSRVELDGGAVARRILSPEVRLIAPALPGADVGGPEVLREEVSGLRKPSESSLIWQEESAYLVLTDKDGVGLSPPIPHAGPRTVGWMNRWTIVEVLHRWLRTRSTKDFSRPQRSEGFKSTPPPDPMFVEQERSVKVGPPGLPCQDGRHALGAEVERYAVDNPSDSVHHLTLLRIKSDGALVPLTRPPYPVSLPIPSGTTYRWCARVEGEIVAVLSEAPWDPAVLVWLTQSVPDPGLGPFQPIQENEVPRGRHNGPPLDTLDGESDGVWIQWINPSETETNHSR